MWIHPLILVKTIHRWPRGTIYSFRNLERFYYSILSPLFSSVTLSPRPHWDFAWKHWRCSCRSSWSWTWRKGKSLHASELVFSCIAEEFTSLLLLILLVVNHTLCNFEAKFLIILIRELLLRLPVDLSLWHFCAERHNFTASKTTSTTRVRTHSSWILFTNCHACSCLCWSPTKVLLFPSCWSRFSSLLGLSSSQLFSLHNVLIGA
jgi:hypothetical protein